MVQHLPHPYLLDCLPVTVHCQPHTTPPPTLTPPIHSHPHHTPPPSLAPQSLPREVQPVARGLLPFLSLTYPDATRPEAFTADADARLLAMPPVSKPRQPVTVLNGEGGMG